MCALLLCQKPFQALSFHGHSMCLLASSCRLPGIDRCCTLEHHTQHRQLPCSHTGLLCAADATLYSGGAGRDDLHDVDVEQHFDMVQSVIQLMTQLLRQSQWQTPDSSFGNTTDIAQAPSVNGASTEAIDSQAVHADNLSADADSWMASSCEAPGWPTPSAATWADINAAATRAAFTLETLAPQLAPDSTSVSAKQLELSLALIWLLHSLLAGHIMDPQLDMRPVFLFAMIPLLQGTC